MKKSIELLSLEASTLEWLKDRLCGDRDAPAGIRYSECAGRPAFRQERRSVPADGRLGNSSADGGTITSGAAVHPARKQKSDAGRRGDHGLTPKEFDILHFLARNRGEVFTREQIYQAVWDSSYPMDDSNIMAFIRKLRKKIEPDPDAPEYILTIWGVGYKFRE